MMEQRRSRLARAARSARLVVGAAGCFGLAACASSGDSGSGGFFDDLALKGGGDASDQATSEPAAVAGKNGQKPAGATTTATTPTPAKRANDDTGGTMTDGTDGPEKAELTPRYCYRTLAEVDCYLERRLERRRQRVGSFHDTVR